MHDAWMYLVIAGTGTVLYDDEVVVQYRQHDRNSVGMGSGPIPRLAGRIRRQLSSGGPGKHGRQDLALVRSHGALLRPEERVQLEQLLDCQKSRVARFNYALNGVAHRQSRASDLVLKGLYVFGRV